MILSSTELSVSQTHYADTLRDLEEFEATYKQISTFTKRQTYSEELYVLIDMLAAQCEKNSDELDDDWNMALAWIQLYREFKIRAGRAIELNIHMSSLYFMEQLYQQTQSETYLNQIETYIAKLIADKGYLAEIQSTNENHLEFLTYQLLVASEKGKPDVDLLVQQANMLIRKSPEFDTDGVTAQSLQRVFAKVHRLLAPAPRLYSMNGSVFWGAASQDYVPEKTDTSEFRLR